MTDNEMTIYEYNAARNEKFSGFITHNIRYLYIYRFALLNFIGTSLSSRYRRSALGFFWSLLNPLFTMIVMAVVFSSLYKLPFTSFSLYLFSGLLPWNLVTSSLLLGSMTLVSAESYLKKVYIPKMLFPMATVGVEVVNFSLNLVSLFVLALFFGAHLGWSLLFLPFALLILVMFIFGLVLTVSIMTVYLRDLQHMLQVITLGLFYLTPIMYPVSLLSDRLQAFLKINPFYYFISLFHNIIYESIIPPLDLWLICIGLSVISVGVGLTVFYKKEKDIIYRL